MYSQLKTYILYWFLFYSSTLHREWLASDTSGLSSCYRSTRGPCVRVVSPSCEIRGTGHGAARRLWTYASVSQPRWSHGESMTPFCASFRASSTFASVALSRQSDTACSAREARSSAKLPWVFADPLRMASAAALSPLCSVKETSSRRASVRSGSAKTALCATDSACLASPWPRWCSTRR